MGTSSQANRTVIYPMFLHGVGVTLLMAGCISYWNWNSLSGGEVESGVSGFCQLFLLFQVMTVRYRKECRHNAFAWFIWKK